jgi:CheY-like chemotaxis protein
MITVFVIDRDPAVRLAARRVLEPAGFTVVAAADAAAALARLAVLRADLVVCDIDALAPDGRPVISAIADLDPAAQILALFPKHRDTAGMLPYVANALGKPFTESELLTKVRRALVGPAPPPSP